jgi:hypothetical protein
MRSQYQWSSSLFGYVGLESRIAAKHPLQLIREVRRVAPPVAQNTYDTGRARQESTIGGRIARHSGMPLLSSLVAHSVDDRRPQP